MIIGPIAAEQSSGVKKDDIIGEDERGVRLGSSAHQLVLFAKREDVIAHDIFAPVMLVEAGALGAIDQIVLPYDVCAAFVRVEPPAAIGE